MSAQSISGLTNRLGEMTTRSATPVRNADSGLFPHTNLELQVAKINAMFPTVPDSHIRCLLKK